MSAGNPTHFAQTVFHELDIKLKATGWDGGASEAHGLLTGLACRGITTSQLTNKMYLFNFEAEKNILLLEGMFELILKNLNSNMPVFDLLLPDDETDIAPRLEGIGKWCYGFIQGFCHDGANATYQQSSEVTELVQDISTISGIQAETSREPAMTESAQEDERALMEIEQFLRVGIQLIYEETAAGCNPLPASASL